MRLLLIRHGETSANAEGRLQGHLDLSLGKRGRRESERLAERLSLLSLDILYSSPLKRARETADRIEDRLGLTIKERPALMERDLGKLAGLTGAEIIERYPQYIRARTEARDDISVPGYEQDAAFARRVSEGVGAIIEAHPGERVVVVTHGGVIAAFLRETLSVPTARHGTFALDNASITTFDVGDDGEEQPPHRARVLLVSHNDTCHLDGM